MTLSRTARATYYPKLDQLYIDLQPQWPFGKLPDKNEPMGQIHHVNGGSRFDIDHTGETVWGFEVDAPRHIGVDLLDKLPFDDPDACVSWHLTKEAEAELLEIGNSRTNLSREEVRDLLNRLLGSKVQAV